MYHIHTENGSKYIEKDLIASSLELQASDGYNNKVVFPVSSHSSEKDRLLCRSIKFKIWMISFYPGM